MNTRSEHHNSEALDVPIQFVPTPTWEYRAHNKELSAQAAPSLRPSPKPMVLSRNLPGARVLMWKQDPSVTEIGVRKVYLPTHVYPGPRDSRIAIQGVAPVIPNVFGDMIQVPGSEAFDAVHTFAVVRETLSMFQRVLHPAPIPWQWNSASNAIPLNVMPYGLPDIPNAFYSRNTKSLRFGHFEKPNSNPPQRMYTCRSLDIVAHETGHAILDGIKPNWITSDNLPQTGALHESFADLTAIFLALAQMDQVEAIIAQTKANLHDKTFLADVAEEMGLALGRSNGLRNADNNFKLSQPGVGTNVHALSQVFTGGVYDVLADIFAFEQRSAKKDDALVLYETGLYVCSLVLRAIIAAPNVGATFADVVNRMISLTTADGKPVQYRNYIRNRYVYREVIASPTSLREDLAAGVELASHVHDASDAVQNRCQCCGTLQNAEYSGEDEALEVEIVQFKEALAEGDKKRKEPPKLVGRG